MHLCRLTLRLGPFLGLMGHYRHFIKGFTWIAQPLNEHLAGEGASRKLERVSLSEGALKAFEMLKPGLHEQSSSSIH